MKLKVNPIGYLLAQWDAFRTFGWINLVDEPEKIQGVLNEEWPRHDITKYEIDQIINNTRERLIKKRRGRRPNTATFNRSTSGTIFEGGRGDGNENN